MSDTISSPQKQALIEAVALALAENPAPGDYDAVPAREIFPEPRPRYIHLANLYRRQAGAVAAAIEAAGYRIVRPHDWHAPEGWPLDPLARMACRRCGKKDGEAPLSAECDG